MKYLIYAFCLGVTTTSCNEFLKKSPDANDLYNEEISKINWNEVDEPAGLVLCDSLFTEDAKTNCLQETLQSQLQTNLNSQTIKTIDLNVNEIWLALTINPDSSYSVITDVTTISNAETRQNITTAVNQLITELPAAYPAIKRGIPVRTQINIPITFVKE
ncbi:hypothetical protein K5I29_12840 [Flavobacterium agricola]|uniref:TonB C-terminal domain-containing protein n=1 Tax=Flavobacterium agricola TaxID=2870839 RepID=A0ABY6M2Z1_9FLAO|nr:hypothetical protein [Flavobacterium agricola]UYW01313.1 hypothetical protein K5I29_12840 [Flavobacterium agricola]